LQNGSLEGQISRPRQTDKNRRDEKTGVQNVSILFYFQTLFSPGNCLCSTFYDPELFIISLINEGNER
jgi:hypothetical protein